MTSNTHDQQCEYVRKQLLKSCHEHNSFRSATEDKIVQPRESRVWQFSVSELRMEARVAVPCSAYLFSAWVAAELVLAEFDDTLALHLLEERVPVQL